MLATSSLQAGDDHHQENRYTGSQGTQCKENIEIRKHGQSINISRSIDDKICIVLCIPYSTSPLQEILKGCWRSACQWCYWHCHLIIFHNFALSEHFMMDTCCRGVGGMPGMHVLYAPQFSAVIWQLSITSCSTASSSQRSRLEPLILDVSRSEHLLLC